MSELERGPVGKRKMRWWLPSRLRTGSRATSSSSSSSVERKMWSVKYHHWGRVGMTWHINWAFDVLSGVHDSWCQVEYIITPPPTTTCTTIAQTPLPGWPPSMLCELDHYSAKIRVILQGRMYHRYLPLVYSVVIAGYVVWFCLRWSSISEWLFRQLLSLGQLRSTSQHTPRSNTSNVIWSNYQNFYF